MRVFQILTAISLVLGESPTFANGRWIAPKALYLDGPSGPTELQCAAGWLMRWLDENAKDGV